MPITSGGYRDILTGHFWSDADKKRIRFEIDACSPGEIKYYYEDIYDTRYTPAVVRVVDQGNNSDTLALWHNSKKINIEHNFDSIYKTRGDQDPNLPKGNQITNAAAYFPIYAGCGSNELPRLSAAWFYAHSNDRYGKNVERLIACIETPADGPWSVSVSELQSNLSHQGGFISGAGTVVARRFLDDTAEGEYGTQYALSWFGYKSKTGGGHPYLLPSSKLENPTSPFQILKLNHRGEVLDLLLAIEWAGVDWIAGERLVDAVWYEKDGRTYLRFALACNRALIVFDYCPTG